MITYSKTSVTYLTIILVLLAILDRLFTQVLIQKQLAFELNPLAFNGFLFALAIIATVLLVNKTKSLFAYAVCIPFELLMLVNEFLIWKGVY